MMKTQATTLAPQFKPLYKQVQELITERIVEGVWKPGEILPSEFQLADLLGVSQGTVRKALNSLTEENVVYRRQGVGTFVSEHTLQKMLFHFFHFTQDDSTLQELPNAELKGIQRLPVSEALAALLQCDPDEEVILIDRVRFINDRPCIAEQIYLPYRLFAGLELAEKLPHSLYHFYQQQFSVTVHKASDRLKATLATEREADWLGVKIGDPLLSVARVAKSLDGKAVEYRVSLANSDDMHYLVELN